MSEDLNRPPAFVMLDRQCHCLDGAMFAALVLKQIGYKAQIIDLVPEPGIMSLLFFRWTVFLGKLRKVILRFEVS